MNWDDMRVFLALAREGSLTGAALRLKTGAATVSRRIERLEHSLGLPLFSRHQTGYRLTDQGEALLPRAEAAEMAMAQIGREAEAQDQITGLVRLASIESIIAPYIVPAIAPLLQAHPGLNVEILFNYATVNMNRRDADLALRMVRPGHGNLTARQLAVMGYGLYGPADGAQPARHVMWPDQDALRLPLGWSQRFAGDAPRFSVNTLAGQVAAVAGGLGVAVLPHFLARQSELRLLAAKLPDGTAMTRPIWMVLHTDLAGSQRVRSVADAVADKLSACRADLEHP